jgi:hypothetical protein
MPEGGSNVQEDSPLVRHSFRMAGEFFRKSMKTLTV